MSAVPRGVAATRQRNLERMGRLGVTNETLRARRLAAASTLRAERRGEFKTKAKRRTEDIAKRPIGAFSFSPGAAPSGPFGMDEDVEDDGTEILVEPDEGTGSAPPTPVVSISNVGNKDRRPEVLRLLRIFAKSDFKHDFGERDTGRDLITRADRSRFQEMVQRFPVKDRVQYLNKFDALMTANPNGTNLFELLQGSIAAALYPSDAPPAERAAEFKKEVEVLRGMSIEFEDELKASISDFFEANPGNESVYSVEYEFRPDVESAAPRNYEVRAQRYKNTDGTTRNLSRIFEDVTGGAHKFALLVDAATGLSLTKIRNSTLTPAPSEKCSFIMLQNVESDADSATGVNDFQATGAVGAIPDFEILRDLNTSTVVFPIWTPAPTTVPAESENLLTAIKVILNRVQKGEIEASVLIGDSALNISDVGTTSNVKNSSLNGLAARFAAEILGASAKEGDRRKPYIYALLKRMGDWCQALSLLDRTRKYTSIDQTTGNAIPGVADRTLSELLADGYEIGLVTNDRILLAYGTFLGLNVYFTSASPLSCLVYFKNKDDIADIGTIQTRIQQLKTSFDNEFNPPPAAAGTYPGLTSLYTRYDRSIQAAPTGSIPTFNTIATRVATNLTPGFTAQGVNAQIQQGIVNAFTAKVVLSNLGELRVNKDELTSQIDAALVEYQSIPDGAQDPDQVKRKYDAITQLSSLTAKLKIDVLHNESVIERMNTGRYSASPSESDAIFIELAKKMTPGGRIGTSDAMRRAKDILLSIRDDAKQISQKWNEEGRATIFNNYIPVAPTGPQAGSTRPSGRDIENFNALYEAFNVVKAEVSSMTGGQRGGLRTDLLPLLTTRVVFPYATNKEFEETVKSLEGATGNNANILAVLQSLPAAKKKSYIRDEKSHRYSVIDKYLITKEDGDILSQVVADITSTQPPPEAEAIVQFAVLRFILLYHDVLLNRLERLMDEPGPELYPISAMDEDDESVLIEGVAQNVNTEYTENFLSGLRAVALETALLRATGMKMVLPYLSEYESNGFRVDTLRNVFYNGIDEDVFTAYLSTPGEFTPAEIAATRRLFNDPREPLVQNGVEVSIKTRVQTLQTEIKTALRNVRDFVFSHYTPQPFGTFSTPAETLTSAPNTVNQSQIESVLITTPASQQGSSRLESGDDVDSNAKSSGSVPSGGRRGLYAGLRKRSGSSSPPGVRE